MLRAMLRSALALSLLSAAGCTFSPAGGDDGVCTPGCDGAALTTCPGGATGAPVIETCPEVCVASPAPHCGRWMPSNLDAAALDPLLTEATASLTLAPGADYAINTDTGAITVAGTGVAVPRLGTAFALREPKMAVLVVDDFTLPAGVTLTGTGTRALIVVAEGDIELDGVLDFGPGCVLGAEGDTKRCAGPGGGNGGKMGTVAQGCAGGHNGAGEGGGAGGGLGTKGGLGGLGSSAATADELDNCGDTAANPLVPLIGGSGGGAGAMMSLASGGGGGGAVQLSAFGRVRLAGTTVDRATIYVGGAGGQGSSGNHGGGGGGAGGGILLEGATVELVEAALIASGGGGGGGRGGQPGSDGRFDGAVAAGGSSTGGAGDGGDGAVNASPAENGAAGGGGTNTDGGGGGGGGLGRIRINTTAGQFTVPASTLTQGVLSTGRVPSV